MTDRIDIIHEAPATIEIAEVGIQGPAGGGSGGGATPISTDPGNALELGTDGGLFVPEPPVAPEPLEVSPAAGNILAIAPDGGLFVPAPPAPPAPLGVSPAAGNALELAPDGGLFVPEPPEPPAPLAVSAEPGNALTLDAQGALFVPEPPDAPELPPGVAAVDALPALPVAGTLYALREGAGFDLVLADGATPRPLHAVTSKVGATAAARVANVLAISATDFALLSPREPGTVYVVTGATSTRVVYEPYPEPPPPGDEDFWVYFSGQDCALRNFRMADAAESLAAEVRVRWPDYIPEVHGSLFVASDLRTSLGNTQQSTPGSIALNGNVFFNSYDYVVAFNPVRGQAYVIRTELDALKRLPGGCSARLLIDGVVVTSSTADLTVPLDTDQMEVFGTQDHGDYHNLEVEANYVRIWRDGELAFEVDNVPADVWNHLQHPLTLERQMTPAGVTDAPTSPVPPPATPVWVAVNGAALNLDALALGDEVGDLAVEMVYAYPAAPVGFTQILAEGLRSTGGPGAPGTWALRRFGTFMSGAVGTDEGERGFGANGFGIEVGRQYTHRLDLSRAGLAGRAGTRTGAVSVDGFEVANTQDALSGAGSLGMSRITLWRSRGNYDAFEGHVRGYRIWRNGVLVSEFMDRVAADWNALPGMVGTVLDVTVDPGPPEPDPDAASETQAGRIEIATAAEAQAGTDPSRAITPATLRATLVALGLVPA